MNGVAGGSLPHGAKALGRHTAARPEACKVAVPTIVFHGDQDKTVNPVNGTRVVEARLSSQQASELAPRIEQGVCTGGRRYTRKTFQGPSGEILAEHWLLHGAGHAWSGGHAAGSYTDPQGPDASAEMLRFFLQSSGEISAGFTG